MTREIPDGFRHPGDETFNECERKFTTSTFATGGVLFYTDKRGNKTYINEDYNKSLKKLQGICSDCPKYKGCLVNETLLNTLTYVQQKKDKNPFS